MVQCIMAILVGLLIFTLVRADVNNATPNLCNNIQCKSSEKCCVSSNNGAVCCPKKSTCDAELGCIEHTNASSKPKAGECPPLFTECFSSWLFDLCCPLPEAECCDDLVHCCPFNYECDLDNQRCVQKNDSSIYSRIYKREVTSVNLGMKRCGEKIWCSNHDECCADRNGNWKCCKAVSETKIHKRNP